MATNSRLDPRVPPYVRAHIEAIILAANETESVTLEQMLLRAADELATLAMTLERRNADLAALLDKGGPEWATRNPTHGP